MSKPIAFSGLLRQYMAVKKITQEQFCEKFGIGKSTLYRLLADTENTLDIVANTRAVKKFLPKLAKDKKWQEIIGQEVEDVPEVVNRVEPAVWNGIVDQAESLTPTQEVARRFGRPAPQDLHQFREYVSNAGYVRRNLLVFVREFPQGMPDDERLCLKSLFELHLKEFTGLSSGTFVATSSDKAQRFETEAPSMSPNILIGEKYGKPVNKFFENWVAKYIIGRTSAEVLADGVEMLVVEPDPTGKHALDAWYLRGIVPLNTGIATQQRNVSAPLDESGVSYRIPLGCESSTCTKTLEYAQACLDLLNKGQPVHELDARQWGQTPDK